MKRSKNGLFGNIFVVIGPDSVASGTVPLAVIYVLCSSIGDPTPS